ncbi:contactin-associated protein-like 4, partial [Cyprinodon tularosa]|uniref:contactin-associated protein-like 4 n=1 Tax=Cyprinodon tularosa TaxID=77115 RepID=UPI0018E1F62E
IYEQSCEAYKQRGNTSGNYVIDVDGSGPIKPQLIFCNMTENMTWTVIQHNNTQLTKIQQLKEGGQHFTSFDYAVDEELLLAIINQSEYCEQELAYHCRHSHLLYMAESVPLSWWVGGPGAVRRQTYWVRAPPGSKHCTCSLQDCVDPQHHRNCDAELSAWENDSCLLNHKESLPVRLLALGDVQSTGLEISYKVGPLRCYGDKSIWNAAFFEKETSYLHFPTFHGELSADISLLFKTVSSSGVLLENLGIRDFIRLELSSPTQVLFSFDVGNGPFEVSVTADDPLNDNRWHRIQARRNMKEASLHLDDLPATRQEAPADGHVHLQLNSQLFVGGTASRQKGFRGCIRSLQLNGITLDLEERAKVTPGVQAGCGGYCSTYGALCQNRGRCVERTKSFSCDCSSSAYAGVFCEKDVSVSFKPETSIRYIFKEKLVNESNSFSSSITSNLRAETISMSFRTSQTPALVLYVCSHHREYMALLINKQEQLEVRYKLEGSKEEEILRSKVRNLADRRLHSVSISRLAESVTILVDQHNKENFSLTSGVEFTDIKSLILGRVYNSQELDPELAQLGSLGFTGCLSAVLFNSISPLKAALLRPSTSSVVVTGPLVQSSCGSYAAGNTQHHSDQSGSVGGGQPLVNAVRTNSALVGGLIAVVISGIVSALAILVRLLYRRKRAYQNQEVKKTEDNNGLQSCSQNENQKEYFI